MSDFRFATFGCLLWVTGAALVSGQSVPAAYAARLASERSALVFSERPTTLVLLPAFPGDALFRERHETLKAHFTQEGLFHVPAALGPFTDESVGKIIAAVPSLSDLSHFDEENGESVKLFKSARIVDEPLMKDGTLSLILETADVKFGTARFQVSLRNKGDQVELHLVNLDPLKFLFFPSVKPGKALVDLVYFPNLAEPLVYVAWSVRAAVLVPGFIEIERPLRYRALAIKDWYVGQLGIGEK